MSVVLFGLSSLISIGLIYFQYSHVFSQQIISVVLLMSLILLGRFNNVKKQTTPWQTGLAVLLSSFLVQILIISSGGLYSPLLIVVHIYTLGAIFLLNSKSPLAFLLMTLGVLIAQLKYDPILVDTFDHDPWTAVIYGMTFIIIVPLALYLSHSYFIKDGLTKLLRNCIKMQEQKEDSILTALNDLVIVTDPLLKIVSVNSAVEKILQKDQKEVEGKTFFETFTLKNLNGDIADADALSINATMHDKASRYVEGFMLQSQALLKPKAVLIQVRPLIDTNGVITQLVFVMSDPSLKRTASTHENLVEAVKRRNLLLETFSHLPANTPYETVKAKIGLITHIEEDIALAQELEDHQFQEKPTIEDIVYLAKKMLQFKQPMADLLAVKTQLTFADPDNVEAVFLQLKETNAAGSEFSQSLYTLSLETKFVSILIVKMIEIGLLTASATADRTVILDANIDADQKVYLQVIMPNPKLIENQLADFFELNNPLIGQKTHLAFGSGLEGFLFKKICTLLSIPYQVDLVQNRAKIKIEITLDKSARIQSI